MFHVIQQNLQNIKPVGMYIYKVVVYESNCVFCVCCLYSSVAERGTYSSLYILHIHVQFTYIFHYQQTHTHTHTQTHLYIPHLPFQRVEEIMQRTRAKGEELKDKVRHFS